MDLFTHVLVAYLIAYGITGFAPQYLAAGAIAGGLPDGDVLFFPLARRFPILRHHGITHSLFGVTLVAGVGGFLVAPHIAPGNPWVYFVVMEAAGLAHIFLDGLTHFSVPPFLPFSERKLELDADRAINFVTLVVSVVAFYLLLGVERNHVSFEYYTWTLWGLAGFFLAYFGLRLAARFWIGRILRQRPEFSVPVPTGNPINWLLLREDLVGGRERTTYAKYRFGRGIVGGPWTIDVPTDAPAGAGPVVTREEAFARTFAAAREESPMFGQTYHFGEARPSPAGGWDVFWYSLEFTAFGRSAGVRVHLGDDGSVRARSSWYSPARWAQELT
ncbi:MAG: metal-dependent hydrolase [Thermoplasmata archaeon]|nr:metal-dependent hydrolase [Thermoplasmata archaeon]